MEKIYVTCTACLFLSLTCPFKSPKIISLCYCHARPAGAAVALQSPARIFHPSHPAPTALTDTILTLVTISLAQKHNKTVNYTSPQDLFLSILDIDQVS